MLFPTIHALALVFRVMHWDFPGRGTCGLKLLTFPYLESARAWTATKGRAENTTRPAMSPTPACTRSALRPLTAGLLQGLLCATKACTGAAREPLLVGASETVLDQSGKSLEQA